MVIKMRIDKIYSCDVLVIGAGLAGVQAAIQAKKSGKSVILTAKGDIFSGSSFYKGTWGLGLIAPENKQDEISLASQIKNVGLGVENCDIVDSFVSGINPAIENIKKMGIKLKYAENKKQKDFIPCFDYKHRLWHGILADNAKEVFSKQLEGVRLIPRVSILNLIMYNDEVSGAVFSSNDDLFFIESKATIIATGGFSGLFEKKLTSADVISTGHALAVECGAKLVNIEFMQMMPAYVNPCYGTVFNEKTFRYTNLYNEDNEKIDILSDILELRGTYGPFTSRLKSAVVDFQFAKKPITVKYNQNLKCDMPEFIKTYFDWLKKEKGLEVFDEISITSFAHASNGGILIDKNGYTGVNGLYACGEVTGGMHGADRIGGLSTANGLVFGQRAGKSACDYCENISLKNIDYAFIDDIYIENSFEKRQKLRQIMQESCMIVRDGESLANAFENICELDKKEKKFKSKMQMIDSLILSKQLKSAKWILQAAMLRKESRGSHYRKDFTCQYEKAQQIITDLKGVKWKE